MLMQALLIMPYVAIGSCVTLVVAVAMNCTSEPLPRAVGFGAHERRRIGDRVSTAMNIRTPVTRPTAGAPAHWNHDAA
jgi:hypothetical protein